MPGAARQCAGQQKGKSALSVKAPGDVENAAALGERRRRHRLAHDRFPPCDKGGAGGDDLLRLERHEVYAEARPQQCFEPNAPQHGRDALMCPGGVLARLVRRDHQLRPHAEAAQQTEAQQHALLFSGPAAAEQQRLIPGDPVLPQLPPLCALAGSEGADRAVERHRPGDFLVPHAQKRGRASDEGAAPLCSGGKKAFCPTHSLVRIRSKAERKAYAEALPVQLGAHRDLRAQQHRTASLPFGTVYRAAAAGDGQREVVRAHGRGPMQEQHVLAYLRADPETGKGGMIHRLAQRAEKRREAQLRLAGLAVPFKLIERSVLLRPDADR